MTAHIPTSIDDPAWGTPALPGWVAGFRDHQTQAVEEIIDAFAERYEVRVETVSTADENVFFPLPRELRDTPEELLKVFQPA